MGGFVRHCIRHVRAADERAGKDGAESDLLADDAVLLEDTRRDVLDDIELLALRLKVLADRDDLDARFVKPPQDVDDFLATFAEAEHQSRLGRDRGVDPLRLAQNRKRPFEARTWTD